MKEIKNKIITISGEPVSGKSTVKKILAQKYKEKGYCVHEISTGIMFREVAVKEYKKLHPEIENPNLADIQTDKSFKEERAKIDSMIDELIAKKGKEINSVERPDDVYIIDSRLAWHNIPDSYAVRLTIDENIAGQRVFKDNKRGSEDEYSSVEEAIKKTRKRKLGEIERYKERYGVDLTNPENYDLIVDTSHSDTHELADIIIKGEQAYRDGQYYPQRWASPAHFLPIQEPRQVSIPHAMGGYTVEEIIKNIREFGYDPQAGELEMLEYDGALYLNEGNHRTIAALSSGLTLLPYTVTKSEQEPEDISSTRYLAKLYDWVDGIKHYGGNIGNNRYLKDFDLKDILPIRKIPIAKKVLDSAQNQGGENR